MPASANTKRPRKKRGGTERKPARTGARARSGERCAPYDPLAGRMRLMEALWGEFEEWSQRAKAAEMPNPYVIRILNMLRESMQECDDLLERLKLLKPGMCGPEVTVDLTLCRMTPQQATRLPALFDKMTRKLEESASSVDPAKLPNETELLSQSSKHGPGTPIDVEFLQTGEAG